MPLTFGTPKNTTTYGTPAKNTATWAYQGEVLDPSGELLMETGDTLLMELGNYLLLESSVDEAIPTYTYQTKNS